MKTGYLITLLFTASLILPRMSGADDNSRLEQVEILFKLTLCGQKTNLYLDINILTYSVLVTVLLKMSSN